MENVVIIGSGCAGNTAAIYAARASHNPLLYEGREAGGQLSITTDVENYPGFPTGVMGPDLVENMKKQAQRFGARFTQGEITKVNLSERPFTLWAESKAIKTKTLIIASGASARWLGIESEQKLIGPEANPVKPLILAIESLTAFLSAAKLPENFTFSKAGLSISNRSCICEKS